MSSRDWFESDADVALPSPTWSAVDGCLKPLIEVQNRELEIVVTADLPCIERKEDITIHVSEDSLEVSASLGRRISWERWGVFQKRAEFRSFRRIISLPEEVKPKEAKASFKRGILRVTLPKAARHHQIPID